VILVGDIVTGLIFKDEGYEKILKIMKEIIEVAKKSDCVTPEEDMIIAPYNREDNERVNHIYDFFVVDRKTSRKLDESAVNVWFKAGSVKDLRESYALRDWEADRIKIGFYRHPFPLADIPSNPYWHAIISTRELCPEEHYDVVLATGDQSLCPCPDNFKKFCKGVGEVLKKYAVKDSI